MVVIAASLKGRAGQKGWQKLFQATQVVAIFIIIASVKANNILYFCIRGKVRHGSQAFIQVLIIWLCYQAYLAVIFLQFHLQQSSDKLIYMRFFSDDLRGSALIGNDGF